MSWVMSWYVWKWKIRLAVGLSALVIYLGFILWSKIRE